MNTILEKIKPYIEKITGVYQNGFRDGRSVTTTETIRLNRLCWFGQVQRKEYNRIPIKALYRNLGTVRLRGRPRNRWQDEVREDGRLVGGEGWKERVYTREEWKKLQRTARIVAFCTCQWNE